MQTNANWVFQTIVYTRELNTTRDRRGKMDVTRNACVIKHLMDFTPVVIGNVNTNLNNSKP